MDRYKNSGFPAYVYLMPIKTKGNVHVCDQYLSKKLAPKCYR